MAKNRFARPAALGFASHSGWASAVGIASSGSGITVVARERVELIDLNDLESKQPYHAVEEDALAIAAKRVDRWEGIAAELAESAIRRLVARLAMDGYGIAGAGILESSGRRGATLRDTLASHALIHTADGDHFRNAIADALKRLEIPILRVRVKELAREAEGSIGRPQSLLDSALKVAGKEVGPPWGADQKSAALLAWMIVKSAMP